MMLRSLCLIALSCCSTLIMAAADTDSSGVRASKDLGLYTGCAYSLIQLEAIPYRVGDYVGQPDLKNSPGLFAGFCYNFYAGKKSIIRPAVEAAFIPATVSYQTQNNYKAEQRIYPMTLELPLSWIYSAYRTKSFPRPPAKPEFGLSIRPVLAVVPLTDAQPVLRASNLNTDVFVGYPIGNDKSVMRIEFYYSHGWFNLIEQGTDYRTYSINRLQRHTAGLRLIFH